MNRLREYIENNYLCSYIRLQGLTRAGSQSDFLFLPSPTETSEQNFLLHLEGQSFTLKQTFLAKKSGSKLQCNLQNETEAVNMNEKRGSVEE